MAKAVKPNPDTKGSTEPTVASLQKELEAANSAGLIKDQELKDARTVNEQMQTTIEDLELQLDAAKKGKEIGNVFTDKKPVVPTESFKVDKISYVFTLPQFNHAGHHYLSSEALTNQPLLDELVKMEFGGIKRKGQ